MICKVRVLIFALIIAAYGEMRTFTLSCGSAFEFPINLSNTWESFPVFGGGIQCPTADSSTTIGFSAYYGNLQSDIINVTDHPVLHIEINLNYKVLHFADIVSAYATIALIDWAVKIPAEVPMDNMSLIASWENEFGAAFGTSVGFQLFHNFEVSVPLRCSVVFSSPEYFWSFSCGLTVGYKIYAGKND